MSDLNMLKRGEKYDELKDSYTIFICLFDLFDLGLPVYTFENTCIEVPGLKLEDGTTKVFVNAYGTSDDMSEEMKQFLHYITNGTVESEFTKKLDKAVKKVKTHKEWRSDYMKLSLVLMEEREEGKEEGREEGIGIGEERGIVIGMNKALFTLVKKGRISTKDAAEEAKISEEEFKTKMRIYYQQNNDQVGV